MKTIFGRSLIKKFPSLSITEDVMSDTHYWVNIRVGERWLVVEKFTENGFGLSMVEGNSLDFGGHELVLNGLDDVLDWVGKHINGDQGCL